MKQENTINLLLHIPRLLMCGALSLLLVSFQIGYCTDTPPSGGGAKEVVCDQQPIASVDNSKPICCMTTPARFASATVASNPPEMIWIPGGEFTMGTDEEQRDELS